MMAVKKIYHFTVITDQGNGELDYESVGRYSSKELRDAAKLNYIEWECDGEIPANVVIADGAKRLDYLYLKDGE